MPVYSNIALDYAALGLGPRIREQRKKKGWTLNSLAARVSLSVPTLSAIENDKVVLDFERLLAISEALEVRPDVLFPKSRSCHYHIVRRTALDREAFAALKVVDQASGTSAAHHNRLRPLADEFVGKHFEPFQVEVAPVADDKLQFICHHHEEFFFVVRGEIECRVKTPNGLLTKTLSAGDCMYFWSYLPHCIRSTTGEPAYSIHLLYSAQGATDSEYANGGTSQIYFKDVSHKSVTEQIAAKITSVRQARGMSIADFARELEVGLRHLAEIEHGRKPVSIDFLLRICRKFRKPLDYFVASTLVDEPFHWVLRASDIAQQQVHVRREPPGMKPGTGGEFRSLATGFRSRGMHPYYLRLPHAAAPALQLHEHNGQEFVYVLNGEVTLLTTQDGVRVTQTLSSGDSCFIDSTVPHRFVGKGLNPYEKSGAEAIIVFWCPLGEEYLFVGETTPAGSVVGQSSDK